MHRLNLRKCAVVTVACALWACGGGKADFILPDKDQAAADIVLEDATREGHSVPEVHVPETSLDFELFADLETVDLTEVEPGGFGWPCDTNNDCLSGYCIMVGTEGVCSSTCIDDCPENWQCVQDMAAVPDIVYVCVPSALTLCAPCVEDSDCLASGFETGAACVDFGSEGNFCGATCGPDDVCPDSYDCVEVKLASGLSALQCIPSDSPYCECTEYAAAFGAWTICTVANDHGVAPDSAVVTKKASPRAMLRNPLSMSATVWTKTATAPTPKAAVRPSTIAAVPVRSTLARVSRAVGAERG